MKPRRGPQRETHWAISPMGLISAPLFPWFPLALLGTQKAFYWICPVVLEFISLQLSLDFSHNHKYYLMSSTFVKLLWKNFIISVLWMMKLTAKNVQLLAQGTQVAGKEFKPRNSGLEFTIFALYYFVLLPCL